MQGQILQGRSLCRHETGIRQPIVVQMRSLVPIVVESVCRAGVKGDNPGFMKLGLEDVSLRRSEIKVDMIDLEAERLAHPQPGTGQEAEQCG